MVSVIGKILQLNGTYSPKRIGNRSPSGMHAYIPAKRVAKCLPGRGMHCSLLIQAGKLSILKQVLRIPLILAHVLNFV